MPYTDTFAHRSFAESRFSGVTNACMALMSWSDSLFRQFPAMVYFFFSKFLPLRFRVAASRLPRLFFEEGPDVSADGYGDSFLEVSAGIA